MIDLPAEFIERMKKRLGENYAEFAASYALEAAKGIRVNTLKISVEQFKKISPLTVEGVVPWADGGFYVSGDGLGKTVLHAAGAYYVQEPSAMCAVPELDVQIGDRVLDMCAAPGGKTTQIATFLQGSGVLVANEIDYSRCKILRSNVERCGVKNAVTTCATPAQIADCFNGYFNKILVDAPCSGEGMFKKEQSAISEWSPENVARCANRQAEILNCADRALAAGGRLVYSTCTFAEEEDEWQIENFLKTHSNYNLIKMKKLLPHEVRGEGHFCAVLEKTDGAINDLPTLQPVANVKALKDFYEWQQQTLNVKIEVFGESKSLFGFCENLPALSGALNCRCGVALNNAGVENRFEPSHSLAMCLKADEVKRIEVDEQTAIKYLRGQTFDCDLSEHGWRVVTYCNLPLGWCKAVNGTAKNHLPKGLRI